MSYSATVLADAPLGYFRMGESSGTTLTDSSGNGRNGSYSGSGVTLGATAVISDTDKAATFAGGSSGYAQASGAWLNVAAATAFSFEMWVRPTNTTGGFMCGRWKSGGTQFYIQCYPTDLVLSMNISGTQRAFAVSHTLVAGEVLHLAATYDGTTMRLYVNGALAGTGAYAGSLNAPALTDLYLGRIESSATDFFPGTFDEVAVYGSVLSAGRIAAHYADGLGLITNKLRVGTSTPGALKVGTSPVARAYVGTSLVYGT